MKTLIAIGALSIPFLVVAQVAARRPTAVTPTFSKDVAPIFEAKCQSCHHGGTSAPMALLTYQDARPWARSIKEKVARRDMPPWHLDKTVGIRRYQERYFAFRRSDCHDRSVGGCRCARRESGRYAHAAHVPGRQPLVYRHAGFDNHDRHRVHHVSEGPDWWLDQYAQVTLTEDRWVKAMEVKPSNPRVVHHAVVYAIEPDAPAGTPDNGVQLTEYAVGKYGDIFSDNTGRLLKKGTKLRFDMHYFATGKEERNRVTILLRSSSIRRCRAEVPKVRSVPIRNIPNDELDIPPNTVVRTDGYYRLTQNARIDAFQPHMHMRGKGMTLEAINLNNTTEDSELGRSFQFQLAYQLHLCRRRCAAAAEGHGAAYDRYS